MSLCLPHFGHWHSFGCYGFRIVFITNEFRVEGETQACCDICVCMSNIVLLICRLSLMLYSAASGVKNVQVVFSELCMRLFDLVQAWIQCRYDCVYTFAVYLLLCVDVIVMSSVYML